jgi:hypothetical protein
LVVRPAGFSAALPRAYADPATAYDHEAVVVLSELDPALNASPAPTLFDMRNYAPKYFLINGKAYPATDNIETAAGRRVLLRFVNAGIRHHSMTSLGLRQNVVAKDGSPLTFPGQRVAETIAPGQTMDAIVTVPVGALDGSRFALFDGNLNLFNNRAAGLGGMLTFVVTAGVGGGSVPGPATTLVAAVPTPTNGSLPVAVTAMVSSDVTLDPLNVVGAAEFFLDAPGAAGSGAPLLPTDLAYDAAVETVTGTIPVAALAGLASGNHTVFVHGRDSAGTWGSFNIAVLALDKAGPMTTGLALAPSLSNGTVDVALSGTGDDRATGNAAVAAAEYFIDATGAEAAGAGAPMVVNVAAPSASLTASIAASALSAGTHVISVRSQDALGNWGAFATTSLVVDKTGPVTSNVIAAPNPNNGTLPLNLSTPAVRVTATLSDATTGNSNVAAAEGFIDSVGPNGMGFIFVPADGLFNSATETASADIPLTTISALPAGNHIIYVHAKDAAGNWGAISPTVLLVDKAAPSFTSVTLSPTTAIIGEVVALTANGATDPLVGGLASGISGGQFWIDGTATPPASATAFAGTSATFSALTGGVHSVYVRVRDAAGNWSTVRSATLTVPAAVNNVLAFAANNNAIQTNNQAAPGVLGNDLPIGAVGRTATLSAGPGRLSGAGPGTITVTCPTAPNPAAIAVCPNGRYLVTLTGVGATGAARAASKRGTYQFTYTETLNGKTTLPATVTITVN